MDNSQLRGHVLLPLELRDRIPPIYATEEVSAERKVAVLKVFDPCGRGTWYATEFDGEDTLFGFVVSPLGSDCDEWGYFSLAELESVRNRLGLPLERDLYWEPGPIPELNPERKGVKS